MSAYLLELDPDLQRAVESGALSNQEAWLLQDQYLLQESVYLELPESLAEAVHRLQFSLVERHDRPLQ